MFAKFFTILLIVLLAVSFSTLAKDYNLQRAQKVTPADDELFQQRLDNIKNYVSPLSVENANRTEVGRTWYDYATNNVMGRMIAHAYGSGTDGIHTVFMKIFPQGAERYVTYDYYDESLQLFFGNASVIDTRRTGWGRVINGKDDEALISLHTDPVQLFQDAGETGYAFTSMLDLNPGSFAGFGRYGDTIVVVSQHDFVTGQAWTVGDDFKYSTDYGATWLDGANVSVAGVTDYGNLERWPVFNPANPPEI